MNSADNAYMLCQVHIHSARTHVEVSDAKGRTRCKSFLTQSWGRQELIFRGSGVIWTALNPIVIDPNDGQHYR